MQIPIFMEEWVPKVDAEPPPLLRDAGQVPVTAGGGILLLHNMQIVNHRTNLGTFVIMATPHKGEGRPTDETAARQRLKTAAGLLGAVLGRNAVYEPVFDVEINLSGQTAGVITPTFENPSAFRDPNLSNTGLGMLELCAARISALPTDVQHRTQLSLHLLYQAMREMDGVFAFLKYWMAIETLSMPNGTDIEPIIQRLAGIYKKTESEAKSTFAIGHLFGLRGDIVHRGRMLRVGQDLLAYIECVYVDLLADSLGGATTMAEAALKRSGRSAIDLVRAARGASGSRASSERDRPRAWIDDLRFVRVIASDEVKSIAREANAPAPHDVSPP